MTIQWTDRAQADLAAIHAFVEADSSVAEFNDPEVREVVSRPYRIVYRVVSATEIHVLTVHHGAREAIDPV